MENWFGSLLFRTVILHGTIIHFRMLLVQQINHLSTRPKYRSIAVGSIHIDRADEGYSLSFTGGDVDEIIEKIVE